MPLRHAMIPGFGALALLASCHTVRDVRPAEMQGTRPPERVWVTLPDHSTMMVQQPEITGDTLVGMVYGEPARVVLNDSVAVRAREPAPMRTAALAVAGGALLVGSFMYLQSRPDVGVGRSCYYSIIGSLVNPCCQGTPDSIPC